ncbi:centromere protein V [Myxocyprinus asiaticus]|uniref:centromere protein V n=1 Tax=Myxocyprinus asiaticus TaxID=70543 RepID=UPI0022237256|nr:centromere protein V [Myxocyprinus asiaticus]XP_051552575.1 centromere protein V [Myxocyprinus asiaticus]
MACVTNEEERERDDGLVKHTGGCHCGAVRFEVRSAPDLHVFNCNCSICTKKQNHHFIVPKSQFTLLQGSDNITTYTFNTHMAKHTFCKICGVQSFYTPRSNPDGFGVAPHCLDPGTVGSVTVEDFCGQNWEESMKKHHTIRRCNERLTFRKSTSRSKMAVAKDIKRKEVHSVFCFLKMSSWTYTDTCWFGCQMSQSAMINFIYE